MRQQVHRVRGRMLVLAGIVLLAAPFMGNVRARQAPAGQTAPTPAAAPRLLNAPDHPSLRGFRWREIGPTGQGGRIDDFAVDERNPYRVLRRVRRQRRLAHAQQRHDLRLDLRDATASDRSAISRSRPRIPTSCTSAPAKPTTASRARSATAMWKTTNALAANAADMKFENIGLRDTQSIARVIVHPKDPNIGLGRGDGSPLRAEPGARRVHDDRRRQELDEDALCHRRTPARPSWSIDPTQSEQPVGRDVRAAAHGVGLRRRRSRQRHLPEHERRQVLDEGHRQRAAARHARAASRSTSASRIRP